MIKGVGGQVVYGQMVNATTGAAFVGPVTVYVDGDNGGQAIGSVGGGLATAVGQGVYTYLPSVAETSFNVIAFTFIGAGAIPATIQVATITPATVSALGTATGGLSTPVATILADAFREIAVFAPNAAIPPDDFAFALGKLNRLFDNMSDDRRVTFSQSFTAYNLIPNHQPHTIGPNGADFTTTVRPIELRAAQIVQTSVTPNVYYPVTVRDWEWWSHVPVRGISTSLPSDIYYQPDWPNGHIFLWPISTTAYQLEIVTRVTFGQVLAGDVFWYPPGYRDYVTLLLAKMLAPAYPGSVVSPTLTQSVAEAESRLFNANIRPPRLATQDAGMPSNQSGSDFNYKSRTFR